MGREPATYLISGPMAAGKSTVAALLASAFERGVHLEGDLFRRAVVAGRADMTPAASEEALAQLRLRYRLAAVAADAYREAGFAVVVEDVVAGELLREYAELIRSRPLHVVVLLPSAAVLGEREAARPARGYGAWSVEELRAGFAEATPRLGLWLDTSRQTPEETVAEILARTGWI
jgi:chloramphenicol 3-O-phosphotransferase